MRDFDHFHDKLLVVLVMLTLMNDADFDNNAADDELRSCRSRWVWGALGGGGRAALDTLKTNTWSSSSSSSSTTSTLWFICTVLSIRHSLTVLDDNGNDVLQKYVSMSSQWLYCQITKCKSRHLFERRGGREGHGGEISRGLTEASHNCIPVPSSITSVSVNFHFIPN